MDSELEELESLFSEHFGRTPSASQASIDVDEDYYDSEEVDEDILVEEITNEINIDQRAREFLEANGDSNEDDVDEETWNQAAVSIDCDPDHETVRCFKLSGCGCHRNCAEHFSVSEMYTHLLNVREMDKSDKEMYVMASLVDSVSRVSTKRGKKRQRSSHELNFKGHRVCKRTFMLMFDVGKHCLQNLMRHVTESGVVPRTHKNTGKKPSKALTFEDIKPVIKFISNYADEIGIPQPAAARGRDGTAPIYLPSDTTKVGIHQQYAESCLQRDPTSRVVKYSTFNNIWRSCLFHIKVASPRDDVCATCEKLRKQVLDSVTEKEKLESTDALRQHVLKAQTERDTYNTCIKLSKETYLNNEVDNYVHYTFDFSQNVCLPHHSRQMGPVYFMSLRKVQLFGFRIDGIPTQLNFLIDENETIGTDGTSTHGPNSVISMIHWAMETRYSGESACAIHADNCPDQNKNKYVIGYFLWRVMTGRHVTIEYMMQVPGHARCLVDSAFACIKKLYRRTDCDSKDQLEDVVNKSSSTNIAVRYPAWQWQDWKSFLEPIIKPLKGIRVPTLVANVDVKDAQYDAVIVVTDTVDKLVGNLECLKAPIQNYLQVDNAKGVVLIQTDVVPSKRVIWSPTGPLNRDYDDVRRFYDAGEKGLERAVRAGSKKPLFVRPIDKTFPYAGRCATLGALQAAYVPIEIRDDVPDKAVKVEMMGVWCDDMARVKAGIDVLNALEIGRIVTRDVGGSDPEKMAAPKVAAYLEQVYKDTCIKMEVISDVNIFEKEYPLLAAVNRCARLVPRHQGRLIYLEYEGEGPIEKTLFLVGKGITYDTGGCDIKAGGVMAGMHRDKCGAAAVAGFFKTLSVLKPKGIKVVGGLAMVRNSVGSEAYVADEIITSRAGVRVRVGNTDAEGRMVMADVLCRMKEKALDAVNPQIFTIATLTGHAIRAMGPDYSIIMDNGPAKKLKTSQEIQAAGDVSADPFEISTIRRDDYDFHTGKSEYEDVLQCNNEPSSATARGHQTPSAFLIKASGLEKHGNDSDKPLAYSHVDIAGSSGPFPGVPTGSPVLAFAQHFIMPRV